MIGTSGRCADRWPGCNRGGLLRAAIRAAFVLFLCMVVLQPGKATVMTDIQCEIRSRPGASGLELTGVLWSERDLSGDYSFIVDSHGPGGVSQVAQRGRFNIAAGGSHILGTVTVNATASGSFLARFTVRTADGEACIVEM